MIFFCPERLGQPETIFDHAGLCYIIVNGFGPFGTIWDRLEQCWAIAIAICLSHNHLETFGVKRLGDFFFVKIGWEIFLSQEVG